MRDLVLTTLSNLRMNLIVTITVSRLCWVMFDIKAGDYIWILTFRNQERVVISIQVSYVNIGDITPYIGDFYYVMEPEVLGHV